MFRSVALPMLTASILLALTLSTVVYLRRVTPTPMQWSSAPAIEGLRRHNELVSLRVQIADVVAVSKDGWFIGGYKGAWLVKGDALIATDLAQATFGVVDSGTQRPRIRIELPSPVVRWARVDHQRTITYDVRKTCIVPFLKVPEEVRDEAMRTAQKEIEETANSPESIAAAKGHAEAALIAFCEGLGCTAEITWR